jgi:Putative amidase domain
MNTATWTSAANEWNNNAGQLLQAAQNLDDLARKPLTNGGWTGPAGEQAARHIQDLVDRLKVDSLECKAVALVVHGLAHSFQIAQGSLRTALRQATDGLFRVDDSGTVHLPDGPMVRHDPDYGDWCRTERRRLQYLVDQALAGATQADHTGHDALDRLSQKTNVTSVEEAEDGDLGDASKTEVAMIAGTVPSGSRDQVAAWWASLSDADRQTLKLCAPWALENLDGIPDDVKKELKGSDKYDRTGVAKWAIDHWNDNSDDPFRDNCTNFASDALEGGGVKQHNDFWMGTLSDNSWSKGAQTGWGFLDEHDYSHSGSWAQAQTSYEFWTKHGQEVSMADARPGDIIYWEQGDDGYDIPRGEVHHAAVVTSVVDGDIRYTQHSGNQIEASLDGRMPVNEMSGGHQRIHIVRPKPDW